MHVCSAAGRPQICPLYTAPDASTAFVTSPMAPGSGSPVFVQFTPFCETANSPGDCQDAYRTPFVEIASEGSFPSLDPGMNPFWNVNVGTPEAGRIITTSRTTPTSATATATRRFIHTTPIGCEQVIRTPAETGSHRKCAGQADRRPGPA